MTPTQPGSGSHALLLQMIEQNDQKHEAGHRRLRNDLTEGLNGVNDELAELRASQASDHERLVTHGAKVERRKELSMNVKHP